MQESALEEEADLWEEIVDDLFQEDHVLEKLRRQPVQPGAGVP